MSNPSNDYKIFITIKTQSTQVIKKLRMERNSKQINFAKPIRELLQVKNGAHL